MAHRGLLYVSLFSILTGLSNATATLTSTGCADAAGMEQCANGVTTSLTECVSKANGNDNVIIGCGCAQYIENYNCYASYCWNRVFECEYQEYLVEYFNECPIAKFPVPYFPAPNDAQDACSCNLGNVQVGVLYSLDQSATCSNTQITLDADNGLQAQLGCQCCALSGALSSIFGFCPTTDPTLIGLAQVNTFSSNLGTPFSSCSASLTQFNCTTDLGFQPPVEGGSFIRPDDIITTGTATLTNVPGTVTAPASGAVFTYTNNADQLVYTISAANVRAGSGGSGSGGSAQKSPAERIRLHRGIIMAVLCLSGAILLNLF